MYKLIYSFCSILEHKIVILYCFFFFIAIAYAFIFNIVDVVVYQSFSWSCKVEVSKTFVPDYKRKFVTLYQMDLLFDLLVGVVFCFEEVSS